MKYSNETVPRDSLIVMHLNSTMQGAGAKSKTSKNQELQQMLQLLIL